MQNWNISMDMTIKKNAKLNIKVASEYLEYSNAKDDLLIFKCLLLQEIPKKNLGRDLRKWFANIDKYYKH